MKSTNANDPKHNTQEFCVPLVGKMDKMCIVTSLIVNKHEYIASKRRAVTLQE